MTRDTLWHMTHPRNTAYEEAFERGGIDRERGFAWPTPYADTTRGPDEALIREWRISRFSSWAPTPTPLLERDAEALGELSATEIREASNGKFSSAKDVLEARQRERKMER